jgi:2-C-methyl-D-erythritol 4-phosphate cytidylyltransferase
MSVVALVPAAGAGTRLGSAEPKAFVPLGGIPLVVRAVRGLLDSAVVDHVVVAAPVDAVVRARELLGELATVVAGGVDRTASVRAALAAADQAHPVPEIVLVHDAARALAPAAMVRDLVAAVRSGCPAVVPVLPLVDTVKWVDASGRVSGTADRGALRAVQTPQAFAADLLRRAHASAPGAATDDAGLVEALGESVHTIPGHPLAFKITTRWDQELAERLIEP